MPRVGERKAEKSGADGLRREGFPMRREKIQALRQQNRQRQYVAWYIVEKKIDT